MVIVGHYGEVPDRLPRAKLAPRHRTDAARSKLFGNALKPAGDPIVEQRLTTHVSEYFTQFLRITKR